MPLREELIMDKRNDLEEQLKEIAGGTFGEDAVYSLTKFNNPAAVNLPSQMHTHYGRGFQSF
jgi:hypothetical protein